MKSLRSGIIAAAVLVMAASPALADNYTVIDGNRNLLTFGSKLLAGVNYQIHLLYGLFGSTPTAVNVDGSGNIGVNVISSSAPAGSATAGNQVTGNASLTSIDGKVPAKGAAAKTASTPVTIASDQFQATSTSAAVTITTALTFQSALASSATRKGCLIQNTSVDVEYVFVGANGSASAAAALQLQPGQPFNCNFSGVVVTDNISMTSATLNGATAVVVSQ